MLLTAPNIHLETAFHLLFSSHMYDNTRVLGQSSNLHSRLWGIWLSTLGTCIQVLWLTEVPRVAWDPVRVSEADEGCPETNSTACLWVWDSIEDKSSYTWECSPVWKRLWNGSPQQHGRGSLSSGTMNSSKPGQGCKAEAHLVFGNKQVPEPVEWWLLPFL